MPASPFANVEATEEGIAFYLRDTYGLPMDRAKQLMATHRDVVESAIQLGSYCYYPGDLIAEAAEL
jgi:hypothetical protein